MVKTLACRDVGTDCDYVVRGETDDEVIAGMYKHGKEVHKLTDELLESPDLMEKVKTAIKNE